MKSGRVQNIVQKEASNTVYEEEIAQVIPTQKSDSEDGDIIEEISMEGRNKKREYPPYMNVDFILGSVARVKRLWSLTKSSVPGYRKNALQF